MNIITDIEGHRWFIEYYLNGLKIDLEVDFRQDLSKVISDIRNEKISDLVNTRQSI